MRKILLITVLALMSVALYGCNTTNPQTAPPISQALDQSAQQEVSPSVSTVALASFNPSGEVLAGTTTPFVQFNQADYELAKSEGRPILLTFHAEWCPVCQTELVGTKEAFNELENSNLVGFHVDYKDGNVDDVEKALAKEFNIIFQHTKVIVKDGEILEKTFEEWRKEDFVSALASLA